MFNSDTVSYKEPNQGGLGTCYFISSIAGASEWPDYITDMFVMGTGSDSKDAGIIGVKFFIRGKPWVVTIDDKLPFQEQFGTKYLVYAQPSEDQSHAMWAPILEKAWSKVKGDFEAAEGGFNPNGLKSLVGVPVFPYNIADVGTNNGVSKELTFDLIHAANVAHYPLAANTAGQGGSD